MNPSVFQKELNNVLAQVIDQRHKHEIGLPGPGTMEELSFIIDELTLVAEELKAGKIKPLDQRWLSSARIVTDSWSLDEDLGDEICRLDYLYRHELLDFDSEIE